MGLLLFLFLLLLQVAHVAAEGVTLQGNPTERRILRRPHAKARLWTIAKFFSEQDCEFVRKSLEEHLHRCADGYDLGDLAVEDVGFPTKHRTCEEVQGEDIPEDLVASPNFSGLVRRLDQLMANATKSESIYEQHGLQFVKYGQGGRFDMHYDRNYNNIFATAMVYCSSAESEGDGGETFFPNIDFRVRPTTGMAVVWFNSNQSIY
eukprot:g3393.t1